ncbi:neutral/alkaline non-lysosomal ceramidase N-terminal domain-containing protein [Paenibacillus spongiae]|uniref:Neutral/alkaline non-lysosomal ceramidase N-terminal domain-containing protein n=1 Tax=Paenibacillus spongiae TaxID=2909671 RepID=A0ABY5SDA3_9BACL|nr:neutral/alkaline non-lysosomal ceramidase N-terminal domain-containing protein [Paenibacillus spongiae]UVI31929.1 neutral/alkaline non-lysosomal ceramidase N-terminal domain-containing protein [Paenibacillus spongiae]
MKMMLGTGKADITPPYPVPLAGFSERRDVYEGVARPLYVRVWLFEQDSDAAVERRQALIIQADLIWWGTGHVEAIKRSIQAKWGISPEHVFFHASHTHGGPQTTSEFNPLVGVMAPAYLNDLERAVEQAIADAHLNVEAVTMEKGSVICEGIGISRRRIVNGAAQFAPNPDGLNDNEVTVIRCLTEDGRMKGLLFHFTCHPTITNANWVTSEYCGAAMELLDREWGDGVSCFLQGCCGDIRPSLHKEGSFYRGDEGDIANSGAQLSAAVNRILTQPMTRLEPARIEGWITQVELPFRPLPFAEYGMEESEVAEAWKAMQQTGSSSQKDSSVLCMQLLKLADGLALIGMNGEMVVEYGVWIKREADGRILPLGYSNGMIGYVPTAAQIEEGGYESVTSGYVFGYPAPFASDVESRIKEALHILIGHVRA